MTNGYQAGLMALELKESVEILEKKVEKLEETVKKLVEAGIETVKLLKDMNKA